MKILSKLMDRLDRLSSSALLWVNVLLCAFVLLAHGGVLLLVKFGGQPEPPDGITIAYLTVPVTLLALGFAAVAFFRKSTLLAVLKFHTVILLAFSAYAIYFGLDMAIRGLPAAGRVAWNPILFALVVGYPALLFQRAFPHARISRTPFRYTPVFAAFISVFISAAVMWRIWAAA